MLPLNFNTKRGMQTTERAFSCLESWELLISGSTGLILMKLYPSMFSMEVHQTLLGCLSVCLCVCVCVCVCLHIWANISGTTGPIWMKFVCRGWILGPIYDVKQSCHSGTKFAGYDVNCTSGWTFWLLSGKLLGRF